MRKNPRRNTKQRKIIFDELSRTKNHPDADGLFRIVRRRLPNISIGTVYRNLNLLRDEGKIKELALGRYSSHYDADLNRHSHFYCLGCGDISDVNEPLINRLDIRVSKDLGMAVKYHRLDFYGYCGNCKDKREVKK